MVSINPLQRLIREYILIEGRLDKIKSKFPDIDVDELSKNDPSRTNKYLDWMAKQMSLGAKIEDLYPTVEYFHSNIAKFSSKDINSYKTLKDLEDAVKSASEKKTGREKRKEAKSRGETIYENNDARMIYIGDKQSCQTYGAGTKWCITMKDVTYFEQYTGANVVFYFVMKKQPLSDPFDKIALAVKRDKNNKIKEIDFFDSRDRQVTQESLVSEISEFNKFVDLVTQDAVKRPKGLIAKINDKEATPQEEIQAFEMYENEVAVLRQINFRTLEAQLKLAENQDLKIRQKTAWETDYPEVLTKLSNDKDEDIRISVAANTNTPSEALLKLSNDKENAIRMYVAANTSTPSEALLKLSSDENNTVRMYVATNTNTPLKVLLKLSNEENKGIKIRVGGNLSTSPEILANLSNDENDYVRAAVASNPNTPQETLLKLSSDENSDVRIRVVNNSSASEEVLRQLSNDESEEVKISVAEHLNTSEEVLMQLVNDRSQHVRRLAQQSLSKRK